MAKAPIPMSAIHDLCAALEDFGTAVGELFNVEDFKVVLHTHSDEDKNITIIAIQSPDDAGEFALTFE